MNARQDWTTALETRLRWLRWAVGLSRNRSTNQQWEVGREMLRFGDTFLMTSKFADLVHFARQTIPDQLMFEMPWVPTTAGWLWIEKIVQMADLKDNEINNQTKAKFDAAGVPLGMHALGWHAVPDDDGVFSERGGVFCMTYQATLDGYSPWSCFTLRQGDVLIDSVRSFDEDVSKSLERRGEKPKTDFGKYERNRNMDLFHEVRWVYTAFHLMSQKLAVTIDHDGDRAMKRRFAKDSLAPAPLLRVVTLRRLEEDRPKPKAGESVDWNWQWVVNGHWTNQWYPSIGKHKHVWIDSYIKGPEDKPLKAPSATLYVAGR